MFKKILLMLVLILTLAAPVLAQEAATTAKDETVSSVVTTTTPAFNLNTILSKLPILQNSVLYSLKSNKVTYALSFSVLGFWKMEDGENLISVDALYGLTDELGGMVTLKLVDLGKYVNFPIIKYINLRPGVYATVNNIGNGGEVEFNYGVGLNILAIKF